MRLRIKVRHQDNPFDITKHLVYIPRSVKTIIEIEQHIKDVIGINNDIVLRSQEFVLPKKQSIQVIQQGTIIDCFVPKGKKHTQQVKSKKNKVSSKKVKSKSQSSSSSVEIQIKKPSKKAKFEIVKHNKKTISKQSSSCSQQSNVDSSSQNKSFPIKRTNNINKTQTLIKKTVITPQFSSQKTNLSEVKCNSYSKQKSNQSLKIKLSQQQQQSQKQSDKVNNQAFKTFNLVNPAKRFESKPKLTPPAVLKNITPVSQQISSEKHIIQKKPQIIYKPQVSKHRVVIEDNDDDKKEKMIQIPIKSIQAYTQANNKGFLIQGDIIQYRITEFDEQKFIPVLSDWISAVVKKTQNINTLTLLVKNKEVKLSQINLFGLKVSKQCLRGQRQQYLKKSNLPNHPIIPLSSSAIEITQIPKQSTNSSQIITQLNYYFSDNNYNKDNYLISHASKNPQLYIQLKCFMNFNKLKSLVKNQIELEKAIRQSDLTQANFQIHPQNKMIRKKGLRIQ